MKSFGSGIGLSLLSSSIASLMQDVGTHPFRVASADNRSGFSYANKVHKITGKTYPHSSFRQHMRYARQIADGQLTLASV